MSYPNEFRSNSQLSKKAKSFGQFFDYRSKFDKEYLQVYDNLALNAPTGPNPGQAINNSPSREYYHEISGRKELGNIPARATKCTVPNCIACTPTPPGLPPSNTCVTCNDKYCLVGGKCIQEGLSCGNGKYCSRVAGSHNKSVCRPCPGYPSFPTPGSCEICSGSDGKKCEKCKGNYCADIDGCTAEDDPCKSSGGGKKWRVR